VRVAFVGKGGAGKSLIAGTIARFLGRRGTPVLALDIDTMPGLALSLGMRVGPGGLPARLVEQRKGAGWVMTWDEEPGVLVAQHAVIGPDNVRLLTLGKLPGHVSPGSSAAFRHVALGFKAPGWSVVGDLAAGTRQAFFGWAGFAETVVLVVEPTAKAILSARRLSRLRSALETVRFVVVANKVKQTEDVRLVRDSLELPVAGSVPYDELVREAERAGRAPIEAVPDAPAVNAIGELLAGLEANR
jgi:CO dehydrogenase maturation factor